MHPISIVLADDHALVRQGISALLAEVPEFRVVGETGDGMEALRLIDRLRPDVLVADVTMPGLGGLEVTRRVGQESPQTRVIILSMHADEAYVLEALRNGAAGSVLKGSQAAALIERIREELPERPSITRPLTRTACG